MSDKPSESEPQPKNVKALEALHAIRLFHAGELPDQDFRPNGPIKVWNVVNDHLAIIEAALGE